MLFLLFFWFFWGLNSHENRSFSHPKAHLDTNGTTGSPWCQVPLKTYQQVLLTLELLTLSQAALKWDLAMMPSKARKYENRHISIAQVELSWGNSRFTKLSWGTKNWAPKNVHSFKTLPMLDHCYAWKCEFLISRCPWTNACPHITTHNKKNVLNVRPILVVLQWHSYWSFSDFHGKPLHGRSCLATRQSHSDVPASPAPRVFFDVFFDVLHPDKAPKNASPIESTFSHQKSRKPSDLRKGFRKVSKNLRFEHLNSCTFETQLEITFQRRKSPHVWHFEH